MIIFFLTGSAYYCILLRLKQTSVMKLFFTALLLGFSVVVCGQAKDPKTAIPAKDKEVLEVEAACGQCKLGLKGKGCNLAIRLNGKAYFVDGTDIDGHGDAHADDGFCN